MLAWGACALLLVAALVVFGAGAWLRHYLHSDRFRVMIGQRASEALDMDGSFGVFRWEDTSAHVEGFSGRGFEGAAFSELRAEGLRAEVNLEAARDGVWEIRRLEANRLYIDTSEGRLPAKPGPTGGHAGPAGDSDGWLASLLPDRVAVREILVHDLVVDGPQATAHGVRVLAEFDAGNAADITASGGTLHMPGLPEVRLGGLGARVAPGRVYINDMSGTFAEAASLEVSGDLVPGRPAELDLAIEFDHLGAAEVLPEDWAKRITGQLQGRIEVRGRPGTPGAYHESGTVTLTGGVIEALPVLDEIAKYTRTENFRRLVLSKAEIEFNRHNGALDLPSVNLESTGLTRVTGSMRVVDGVADGTFEVGVTPGALRWVPSAEQRVFTREADGFRWTTVRVWGPVGDLKQDLVTRLVGGAIDGAVESVAGAVSRLLPATPGQGDDPQGPDATGEGLVRDAIETGGALIRSGGQILEGLFPRRD
jgi:hypothetical protein